MTLTPFLHYKHKHKRSVLLSLIVGWVIGCGLLVIHSTAFVAQPIPSGLPVPTAGESLVISHSGFATRAGSVEYSFGWLCTDPVSCDASVFHNLVDVYPSGGGTVSYVSATPQQGTCSIGDSDSVSCDLSPFNGGQEIRITFVVNYTDGVDMFQHNAENVAVEVARRILIINPVGTESLVDGGVESTPLNTVWKIKGSAKQKCNNPPKIVAFAGNCAFQVKAGGQITQKFVPIDWVREDAMWFGFYAQTKNANVKAVVTARLTYDDGTKRKLEAKVDKGTTAYSLYTTQLSIFRAVDEVRVRVNYGGTTGKVLLDAFSLIYVDKSVFED